MQEKATSQCIELMTGETLWTERVGTGVLGGLAYADRRLYVTNPKGETLVPAAKATFEVRSHDPFEEVTRASIAIFDGAILIRTCWHRRCIR